MSRKPVWMSPKVAAALVHGSATAAKLARRADAGARAKRHGQWFEAALERGPHAFYALQRSAKVERVHPPVVGPPGQMRPAGRGPVDFAGTLAPHGRSVLFDAKVQSGKGTFLLRPESRHQAEAMLEHRLLGGFVFFLVCDHDVEMAYMLLDLERLLSGRSVKLVPDGNTVLAVSGRAEQYRPSWDWLGAAQPLLETPYA